ncbi:MAG: GNAT family N-acetyltransferase [Alistipes sp.]|jgi:GNAT superfamily N-acetyltransferase|nr:GNAT family N-acetyltransferase [Alistipes sp.]
MEIRIEAITREDHGGLVALFREFAEFEKMPHKMVNSVERMAHEADFLKGFVARAGGESVGERSGGGSSGEQGGGEKGGGGEKSSEKSCEKSGGGEILGYATCFFAYYSWTGKSLYMDDLYVRPEWRGHGIGTKLIRAAIDFARENGCHKMRWQVSEWNAPAIGFYTHLGAQIDDTERNCDLTIDA